ncbi:ABC transporter A, ABCA [Kipferlia bialata]|uniref:ABC transporter A, ABCA n=1 Tax=Kipferlia bialata TaxID=797122 RepID=A0A9K3D6H3_9EUKA|nr:ABC transporter A, ABCA [Kipferlia bialata]|eukprot:g11699.t1
MDEAEALCNRITILTKGEMRCNGSSQHLKTKYGQNYTVTCKTVVDGQFVLDRIKTVAPTATLLPQYGSLLNVQIPQQDIDLAGLFGVMQTLKDEAVVDDYGISQPSLESVFISLVRSSE